MSKKLPVAVIGLGGVGRLTLRALLDSDLTDVVGVADRDPQVAEEVASGMGLPAYTDNRLLLVERRPRAVYLSAPPMAAPDLIEQCAGFGIHVWKEQPLARSLDEGLAMVRRMERAKLKLAVGTQRRFAVGYRRAWEIRSRLRQVFLGRSHYLFNWGPRLRWRGDRASAGGGALLELGYHSIDLLMWMLGLPETVYGISAYGNRPEDRDEAGEPLPIYDTDDTSAALLHYDGGCMASVVTTRSSGPVSEELSLHGRGGSLTANGERCILRDPDGNVLDHVQDNSPPIALFRRQADAFAHAVLTDAKTYECSGRENLLTLAVIDALYLSARTSQREDPRHILRPRRVTVDYCLRYRPRDEEKA